MFCCDRDCRSGLCGCGIDEAQRDPEAQPRRSSNRSDAAATQSSKPLRIAIIGAGIAGLTFANYFPPEQFAHVHITVFERRFQVTGPDGGDFMAQDEALEALYAVGLMTPALEAAIYTCDDQPACAKAQRLPLMRDMLVTLLFNAADAKPNVDILLGTTVTAVDENWCLQYFGNHSSTTSAAADRFDLIVGADGNAPSSCVPRQLAGQQAIAEASAILMITACVPADGGLCVCERMWDFVLDQEGRKAGTVAVASAVGHREADEFGFVQPGIWKVLHAAIHIPGITQKWPVQRWVDEKRVVTEGWRDVMAQFLDYCTDTSLVALCETILTQVTTAGSETGRAPRIHAWVPYIQVKMPTIRAGRVVAIGDAAQTMPTTQGLGGNCAMRDASVLAKSIRGAGVNWTRSTLDSAIDAYEQERAGSSVIEESIESSMRAYEELICGDLKFELP